MFDISQGEFVSNCRDLELIQALHLFMCNQLSPLQKQTGQHLKQPQNQHHQYQQHMQQQHFYQQQQQIQHHQQQQQQLQKQCHQRQFHPNNFPFPPAQQFAPQQIHKPSQSNFFRSKCFSCLIHFLNLHLHDNFTFQFVFLCTLTVTEPDDLMVKPPVIVLSRVSEPVPIRI